MRRFLFVLTIFLVPSALHASVSITEIMYDVSGSDTGREWVEVKADTATDLSDWKLFEANTNHGLTLMKGVALIPSGGFAVIADNSEKFLLDFPSFSGTLFDSSFSLSNTGETISIRDADLADIDSVSYSSGQGALGDGNSLQKINGAWIAAAPTPGGEPTAQQTTDNQQEEQGTTETQSQTQTNGASVPPIEPTIKAYAGPDRTVLAGSDVLFRGKATGLNGESLTPERFSWNFGNGATKDGENVRHTYRYPGNYIAVLDAVSGKYAASDYVRVRVIPADIVVSGADTNGAYVEIANKANADIDVSLFRIRTNAKEFTIPDHTIFAQGASVRFAQNITELSFRANDPITLLYPNGETLFTFSWGQSPVQTSPVPNISSAQTLSRETTAPSPMREDGEVLGEFISTDDDATASSSLSASVSAFPANQRENKNTDDGAWWGALILVTALSAGSVVWVRRKERGTREAKTDLLSADDFDIIEIKEK